MALKSNLFKNGIASTGQKLVRLLEQIVLVPFFISAWGVEYYGEWLTLTIVPTVLAFSDFGFGTSAANSFVLNFLQGDKRKAADISKSAFIIITIVILASIVLSILILYALDKFNVLEKTIIDKSDAVQAVTILIISKLILFYGQLYDGYLRAVRKASVFINIVSVYSLVNISLGFVSLLLGYGIVIYSITQLLSSILFVVLTGIYVTTSVINFKKLDIQSNCDMSIIKQIASNGFGYLLSPVWQIVFFQGSTLVVRIVLGAQSVAIFNTIRALTRSVNQLLNMIDTITFPELQYEIGLKNYAKAGKLYRFSFWISVTIASMGVAFLLLFGKWFYSIWTKDSLVVKDDVWFILILGILFNSMWWIGGVVLRAFNMPYKLTIPAVLCAFASLIVSYFMSLKYSLFGIGIGCLFFEVIMVVLILPQSVNLLEMNLKDFLNSGLIDLKTGLKQLIKKA